VSCPLHEERKRHHGLVRPLSWTLPSKRHVQHGHGVGSDRFSVAPGTLDQRGLY
jgi:hypothetical protein